MAPLRKDIVLPPKLSGDFVKCQECFIDVDAFSLMDHILVCKPQTEDLYNSIDESVETVASYQPILYRSTSNPAGNLLNEVAAIGNVFNVNIFKDVNINKVLPYNRTCGWSSSNIQIGHTRLRQP